MKWDNRECGYTTGCQKKNWLDKMFEILLYIMLFLLCSVIIFMVVDVYMYLNLEK